MGRGRLGSQQGVHRTLAARQHTARYQLSALRSMDDAHLSVALDDIFDNTPVESNQQDADTQRFFNAIGWSDELPEVVDESTFAKAAIAAKHRDGRNFHMLFHTDSPSKNIPDAKTFSDQFMTGKQFQSGGIHGDGAYFAKDAETSWGYGYGPKAAQIRAVLNSKAKVITERKLDSMIATWANKNPQAYNKIINCHQVYYGKNASTHRGARTIFAALFGYNVIRSDQAGGTYTVPNRSALTVQNRVIHRDDWYNKGQKW